MKTLQEYYNRFNSLKDLIFRKFKKNKIDTLFDLNESFIYEWEVGEFSIEFKNKDVLFFGISYKWDYSIEFKYSGHFEYRSEIDHDETHVINEVERILNLFIAELKKVGDKELMKA